MQKGHLMSLATATQVPKMQGGVSRATRPYGREVWRDGVVRNRRVIVLGWGWAMRLDCVH